MEWSDQRGEKYEDQTSGQRRDPRLARSFMDGYLVYLDLRDPAWHKLRGDWWVSPCGHNYGSLISQIWVMVGTNVQEQAIVV